MSLSLREFVRLRIQNDIISAPKRDNCIGTVLVLDDRASAILSSVLKLPELLQKGVTMVENLGRARKAYPSFRGLYLIEPTKENFALVQADFEKKPLYGALYIYTTRRIGEEAFQALGAKPVVKLALALQEANIDFTPLAPSVFALGAPGGWELELDGLASLLSCFKEVERVEVFRPAQEKFRESLQLHKFIGARVKALLPGLRGAGEGYRLKLFLVDRGLDLVTPLLHDFHYEALLADLAGEGVGAAGRRDLNDGDAVFEKYRYQFIKETMTGVSADFEAFLKENPAAQMLRNKDRGAEMRLEKMADVVAGLGQYNKLVEDYNFHIEKIQQILELTERHGLKELAETELTVAGAVGAAGEPVDSARRAELARKLLPTLGEENALRLALLAEGAMHKESASLRALLPPGGQKTFDAYAALVALYGKYWPERDKEKFKALGAELYRREDSSLKRHIAKVPYLLREFLQGRDPAAFEGLAFGEGGDAQRANKTANTLFKIKMKGARSEARDVVIVYFTSGVSYGELRALKALERELDGVAVVAGGAALYTPQAFVDGYVRRKA